MLKLIRKIKEFRLKIVTVYILKEFLSTFIIAFLFFFVIFFINNILLIISPLLEKKIPFYLVSQLMLTFFPIIFIFSLPFGVMLATLMTMGRFSSDNEIVGFRALGFNYMQVFGPIFICSFFIGLFTFFVNDQLFPIARQKEYELRKKIFEIKPTIGFKSKTIKKYESMTIYTNIVNDTEIIGLIIIDEEKGEVKNKRIITAERAEILTPNDRKSSLELRMKNTMIQFENKDRPNEFNFGYCDEMSYFINFIDFDDSQRDYKHVEKTTLNTFLDVNKNLTLYRQHKEKLFNDLIQLKQGTLNLIYSNEQFIKDNVSQRQYLSDLKLIDTNMGILLKKKSAMTYKKIKDTTLNYNLIKFYRKFANPLACIIFAIFATPIGIYSKRAGFQLGFIIGLFLTAFYWFGLLGAIILSQKFVMKPFIAMSLPNLIFLIIGIFFLFKRLKE